jgi:hypothetical protein
LATTKDSAPLLRSIRERASIPILVAEMNFSKERLMSRIAERWVNLVLENLREVPLDCCSVIASQCLSLPIVEKCLQP